MKTYLNASISMHISSLNRLGQLVRPMRDANQSRSYRPRAEAGQ